MDIKWIWIKRENKREGLEEAYLESGRGIQGDLKAKAGDRQISIISSANREYIEENYSRSICINRFHENITINDLDANLLKVGDKFQIAESIQEVASIGKTCFEGCKILESGEKCPLSSEVIFTRVIKSGKIKRGDKVDIIKTRE